MKRIDVRYGGEHYSISGRDLEEVRSEIEDALNAGGPRWLRTNYGEGSVRDADLLITPGLTIALIPIVTD